MKQLSVLLIALLLFAAPATVRAEVKERGTSYSTAGGDAFGGCIDGTIFTFTTAADKGSCVAGAGTASNVCVCKSGALVDTDLAGGGDVTAVGEGCSTGACLTDGLATTGTTIFTWEGNVADAEQVTFAMSSAEPAAAYTITFPDETGTVCTSGSICTGYESETHAAEHANGGGDQVDHDTLTNFVANEHVDHSAVNVDTASPALTGGGDLTATRTLDFLYTSTLAGDPAMGAEETVFSTDGTGGGLIFEGASADAVEGLLVWNPTTADKTLTLPDETGTVLTSATTRIFSKDWTISGMSADNQECVRYQDTLNSGPKQWIISCPHVASEVDGFVYGEAIALPDSFDKTADITLEICVFLHTDGGAGTWHGEVAIQCSTPGAGETFSGTWGTGIGLDIVFAADDVANETVCGTSAAIDTDTTGADCGAGDVLVWQWKSCDTDATPSSGCTSSAGFQDDAYIMTAKLEGTQNLGGD